MNTSRQFIPAAAHWLAATLSDPRVWGRLSIGVLTLLALWVLVSRVLRVGDLAPGIVLALPNLIELTFLAIGAWLMGHGWPRREGASTHCAACGFEHARAEDRLLPTCPECGKPWTYFGGLARGKPVRNTGLIAAGCACVMLAFGLIGVRSLMPALFLKPVPTNMLVLNATQLPGYDPQAENSWTELETRVLTALEKRDIAVALLDRRLRQRWLPDRAAEWLHKAVQAGVGGPQLAQRYREEMVTIDLALPETAEVDTMFDYKITAVVRGKPRDGSLAFYLEGMWVEGGSPIMGSRETSLRLPSSGPGEVEKGYIPAQDEGERTIVLKGVVVAEGPAAKVNWGINGQPVVGPGALWTQQVVIKRTVKVAKKPAENTLK